MHDPGFCTLRGASVEAGLAIVMMAIVLDRITQSWAQRRAEATNVG